MKKPTILLVDDEPGQRENIRSYLEPRIDCNIAEAANAEEAINFIKNKPCDIMVVDIKMPGKGGSGAYSGDTVHSFRYTLSTCSALY